MAYSNFLDLDALKSEIFTDPNTYGYNRSDPVVDFGIVTSANRSDTYARPVTELQDGIQAVAGLANKIEAASKAGQGVQQTTELDSTGSQTTEQITAAVTSLQFPAAAELQRIFGTPIGFDSFASPQPLVNLAAGTWGAVVDAMESEGSIDAAEATALRALCQRSVTWAQQTGRQEPELIDVQKAYAR